MAENKKSNPLVGAVIQPVTLDTTTKIDVDTNKKLIDDILEASVTNGLNISALEDFTSISNSRDQIYLLIDTMARDASVAAILKTYAEEVCETADNGHVVWCESTDSNISMFVNYLLDVMNVDKYIYAWVYCLLKYGDVYLKLYRESDYKDEIFDNDRVNAAFTAKQPLHENINAEELDENVNLNIHKINDKYSYYVEMMPDPGTMFELTKYGKTYGYVETPNNDTNLSYLNNVSNDLANGYNFANYRVKSNDVNVYQADDFVHACLEDNNNRFPEKIQLFTNESDYNNNVNAQSYTVKRGKSILIDAYKIWREKSLIENAILLNRITKSSVVRNIQVEVGDMPKSQVQNTLRRIKELFEQKSAINTGEGMTEYTNPGPVENNIYTATHNGQGAITINAIGGDIDVKNLGDLDEWVNKFYSAFGIPKQYYGYTEDGAGFNGGTSLAIISSVFAKGVKRVQNTILQALTDAINLFLLNRGCKSYINNFVLKMKAPLTQEEKDYRDDLTNRISAISNMQSLFGDIEDKSRKLKILKTLVGTLNYGDEILVELQAEIDAIEAQQKKEAEEAEAEKAEGNNEAETEPSNEESANETEVPDIDIPDLDLGNSSEAPLTEELLEEKLQTELITEDSELPSPEKLNKNIDFTKNN